jgi:hypothetical protein
VPASLSDSAEQSRKIQRLDPLLIAALSLAFLFCLQGITWGRVECWNRSQIALQSLRALRPGNYLKPPFHTYLNHVFVVWPITGALKIAQVPTERMKIANSAKLIGSRLVTIALYLGTIALAYSFSHRSYGRFSAVIIAFVFATSAGLVAHAHFLTADIPLLFWMLAAFGASYRLASAPTTRNYAVAGFLTGIAIATKYNGLAVGIALLIAHFFATKGASLRSMILSRQLGIGLSMVLLGFLFGCPTMLYEPKKFWNDFIYNYTVTPRYSGQPDRANYLGALARIPEIVGIPGAILIAGLAILADSNPEATRPQRCRNARIHPERGRICPVFFESGDLPASGNALCFARNSVPDFDDWSGVADARTSKVDFCVAPAGSDLQLPLQLHGWKAFQR